MVNIEKQAFNYYDRHSLPKVCRSCGLDVVSTSGNNAVIYTKRKDWFIFHNDCLRKEIRELCLHH